MNRNHPLNKLLFSLKDRAEKLLKSKKVTLGLIFFIFIILYAGKYFKDLFFITILTIIGSFSMIYLRYFKAAYIFGIELCMFATVLCARAYGPVTGLVVGFLTIFFSLILSGRFKYSSFISILALPLIGFVTPFFGFWPVEITGVAMTIIYDLIIIPFYILLGSRISSSIIFVVTHLMFNYWVFTNVAPLIYPLMIS